MPLVIPKSGPVQYVATEEMLGEILGHDDFDGENWAIGDRLIFENGTEARIQQEPGELFYVWDEPTPADFEEVKRAAGVPGATEWRDLFGRFEAQSKRSGCGPSLVVMCTVLIGLAGTAL